MSFYDDHDLAREAREDRRRDTPDESEMVRMQAVVDEWVRERESAPIGTRLVRKAA